MAKTPVSTQPLSFVAIVMRADVETIRKALEARGKIDTLLAEREEAYRKIAAIEAQVNDVMGEENVFVFPEPPLPVAGFNTKAPNIAKKPEPPKPAAPTPKPPAPAASTPKPVPPVKPVPPQGGEHK